MLDSLNFAKQDENYAPPKVKSGSVAQAMLSKVSISGTRVLVLSRIDLCVCVLLWRNTFGRIVHWDLSRSRIKTAKELADQAEVAAQVSTPLAIYYSYSHCKRILYAHAERLCCMSCVVLTLSVS